jgi:hypothetical protein
MTAFHYLVWLPGGGGGIRRVRPFPSSSLSGVQKNDTTRCPTSRSFRPPGKNTLVIASSFCS